PNESQAKVGFFMVYSLTQIWGCSGGVCFDFPFSRTVSQAIDVYVACKGWQNGTGDLGATTVVERAYMDPNHSLLEDTLFGLLWNNIIPSIVESRIRSSLSSFDVVPQEPEEGDRQLQVLRKGMQPFRS